MLYHDIMASVLEEELTANLNRNTTVASSGQFLIRCLTLVRLGSKVARTFCKDSYVNASYADCQSPPTRWTSLL